MKVNPNDAAYPCTFVSEAGWKEQESGLPVRLELAARMLSGILAAHSGGDVCMPHPLTAAKDAFEYADALLALYNESQP